MSLLFRPARRLLTIALAGSAPVLAQDPAGYRQPPEPIRSILDATPTPLVRPSPDRTRLLLLERASLPAIADVAAPYIPMAGLGPQPGHQLPRRGRPPTPGSR